MRSAMNKLLASLSVCLSVCLVGTTLVHVGPPDPAEVVPRGKLQPTCASLPSACLPARPLAGQTERERERERMMPRTFPIVLYPAACPGAKKPISIQTSRLRTHSGRERAQRRQPTRPPAIIGFGAFGLRSDGVTHPSSPPSFLPSLSVPFPGWEKRMGMRRKRS